MAFVADEFAGKRFGKYEVLCRIAVGGMAEIFLGFAFAGPFAFKPVVLKRILSEQREDPTALQMLLDEAKLTAQLTHPHIAQVLDLEIADDEVLLVIELIQGANVEELIDLFTERKEPLPLGLVIAVIRDAAQGLQHAHSHKDSKGAPVPIIHRDVTPRNLMVTFDGVTKVLDFGIARAAGASRRTVAGMVRGTAAYMSPEQAIDAKVDTRSDIFSLGVIFHELLVGQRLFARGNPAKEMAAVYEAEIPVPSVANKRVPKALDAVVLRALERSVSRRYQTPQELIRDLSLAAGSAAWPPERCGQLVRERFETRHRELIALLTRIPDDPRMSVSTDVGRREIEPQQQPTVVAPLPGIVLPNVGFAQTATVPSAPRGGGIKVVTAPPMRKSAPRPREADADAQVATNFFTPQFGPPQPPADSVTDEGPVPQSIEVPKPTILATHPPVEGNPTTPMRNAAARRRGSNGTETFPHPPREGSRTIGLVVWALMAMVLGAGGGVLVYRTLSTQRAPQTVGLGRLSIETDRPAEVRLGDEVLQAPFADVYLPAGHHALSVREGTGPWKGLEIDVAADKLTRLEVKLDALAPAP